MGILENFGVLPAKLIAQVLIFLFLYLVLNKFAFGPVVEMLEKRKARIAEGEENLKKIQSDLEHAEQKAQEVLQEANAKADGLIQEARESAEALADKKKQEAQKEVETLMAKAKKAASQEKESAMAELKKEFGSMVVAATSKVTGKVLNDDDQKRLQKEAASEVSA